MPVFPTQTLVSASIGLALSSGFALTGISLSTQILPALYLQPSSPAANKEGQQDGTTAATPYSHSVRQWNIVYDYGKKTGPAVSLLAALSYITASFGLPNTLGERDVRFGLLVGAAVVQLMVVPYTLGIMGKTNKELIKRAGNSPDTVYTGSAATKDILEKWGRLNLGRSIIPLLAAGCAISALVI